MTYLFINTSAAAARVALATDGRLLAERTWPADTTLGTKLLAAVAELLAEQQLTVADLDRIAVHHGPGHHSALRLGIVTGTLMAKLVDAELVEVSSNDSWIVEAAAARPVDTFTPQYSNFV